MSFVYTNLAHLEQYNQDLLNLVTLYEQEYPQPTVPIQEEIEAIDLDFLIADIPKIFDSMKVGSQRVHKIVESLRNFSHLDEAGLKSIDIHQGIDNTIILLRKRLEDKPDYQKIELIKNYSPLPLIDCYPSQINQVFFYLLSNAIDSLDEYNQHRLPADIATNPSIIEIITKQIDSDWIAIEIIDNGLGIPPEIHSKIFDPFFTTKPVGKGTGLGLSISHQIIVEKHRGMIICNSVPGEGTFFIIKLPVKNLEIIANS
jgi:signal transduction histidine kinase